MNLHEYQAKKLFRDYDISVSEGLPASSSQEAEKIALSLNVDKWVVKAQVHAGGRGKAGGVKILDNLDWENKYYRRDIGYQVIDK